MDGFDVNGARVKGIVRADKARVLYLDRRLYVALEPDDVRSWPTDAEPKRWAGGMKVLIASSWTTIQPPGCGCKKRPELGALSREEIVERASVDA